MDPFLTRDEKRTVQKMYDKWNKHAKADILLEKLIVEGMLHEREIQELQAKQTMYDKNKYLYDAVLSRSTYDCICKLKNILYDLDDDSHRVLADMLPKRDPVGVKQQQHTDYGMEWDSYTRTPPVNPQQQQSYRDNYNRKDESNVGGDAFNRRQGSSGYPGPQTGGNQSQGRTPEPSGYSGPPTRGSKAPQDRRQDSSGHSGPQTGGSQPSQYQAPPNDNYDPKYAYGHLARSNSLEQQSSRPDPGPKQQGSPRSETGDRNTTVVHKKGKLNQYPIRPNNPVSGKGLCVIIANFTDDLQGYKNDISLITEFFGKTLGYTVLGGDDTDAIGYRDLTSEQCKEKMTWLKTELENGKYKTCDRFFLFVLSHGDKVGIKMVPPLHKNDNMLRDRITSEYLVETFAHGQLPNLKSYPKCFFIQVCSGTEIAKAAHGSPTGDTDEESRSPIVAVGADTLVCHAAKEGKYSWVSQGTSGGSWFLQATLGVFKEHHKEEHILDMLTEVNDRVSKKYGLANVSGSQGVQKVFQLPAISNNLTKKLYLKK